MDILIKSLNRSFYLDRCLLSIYKFTKGVENITVVDDGTPKKYLDKIKTNFPNVKIITSSNYEIKSKLLEIGEEINGYIIPVLEWKSIVKKAEKYILVIEDDVWFTDYIDFNIVEKEMNDFDVDLVKLGWQGSTKYSYNFDENNISELLISQNPNNNIFLANSFWMSLVIDNKYKLRSILHRLNKFNNYTIQEYYELFSILMGIYNKKYWEFLWKDITIKVNEKSQMINAVDWRLKNIQNKNSICKTSKEYLKTTYISTATNSYRKYKIQFDINKMNYVLNELWLSGKLDSLNNMPNDYDVSYLEKVILEDEKLKGMIDFNSYKLWINEFKNSVKKYGAIVD